MGRWQKSPPRPKLPASLLRAAERSARHTGNQGRQRRIVRWLIAPLATVTPSAGMIWYQGEANAQPFQGGLYGYQLPLRGIIGRPWRAVGARRRSPAGAWRSSRPNFDRPAKGLDDRARGDAQDSGRTKIGIAIAIDVAILRDIHPQNKQDVGKSAAGHAGPRLRLRPEDRHRQDRCRPVTRSAAAKSSSLSHTDGGLVAKGDTLRGFSIAGADKVWHSATGRIDGDKVIVSSSEVSQPVAVRYAWAQIRTVTWPMAPDCRLRHFEPTTGARRKHHETLRTASASRLAVLVAGLLLFAAPTIAAEARRPNVLWIIAEDMGPEQACYGTSQVFTPVIDKLASDGVRFATAYTTAPVCSASRSAFNTGMYQTTIGAHNHRSHREDNYQLPAGVDVISRRMQQAGYFSANVRVFPNDVPLKGTGKTDWNFNLDSQPFASDRWSDLKDHQPFYAQVNLQESHREFHAPHRADPRWS